ncbi:MAG: DNRLRE domain-containing protein, partial [Cytophagales bacterium]|nr:DNRLRE domain-containing protein [Cytophagales bacterium]
MKNIYHGCRALIVSCLILTLILAGSLPGYAQAPTAPAGLSTTDIGETTVDLVWNAATDDVGVTDYEAVELGIVASVLPQADAFVRGGNNANDNYGQDELLTVKKDGNLTFTRRTFMKFDVSTIPSSFEKAILRLHVIGSGVDLHDMHLVPSNSWTENGIKWNNQPPVDSEILATWTTPGVGNVIDVDLTDLVKSEVAGDQLFSIRISSRGPRFINYVSKESSDVALRPALLLFDQTSVLGTSAGDTTFTVMNLTPGQSYDLGVRALDGDGNRSAMSNLLSVTTNVPVEEPSAPANLTTTGVTQT